jgi:hypothetical protein
MTSTIIALCTFEHLLRNSLLVRGKLRPFKKYCRPSSIHCMRIAAADAWLRFRALKALVRMPLIHSSAGKPTLASLVAGGLVLLAIVATSIALVEMTRSHLEGVYRAQDLRVGPTTSNLITKPSEHEAD